MTDSGTKTSRSGANERRPKGEVRRAALQAALSSIVHAGVPSFTLREIADEIGVVHSALYRHFPSRADLVAAVAEQGFGTFLAKLEQVRPELCPGPVARLKRLCQVHLAFALENGPLYKVMFGPEVVSFDVEGTSFHAAATAVLQVAIGSVADCQRAGAIGGDEPMSPGLVFWAMLHGLAMLAIDRRLEAKLDGNRSVERLLDLSVNGLLDGLTASGRDDRDPLP